MWLQVAVGFSVIQPEGRIVGGRDASIDEVPFLVQIKRDNKIYCAGTRASDRHIITAAHCVYGIPQERFTVVGAASKLSDIGIRSEVSQIIIHPNYDNKTYDMDIAVMILKSGLIGTSFTLPPHCNQRINPEDEVQVFGWGELSESTNLFPNQLQTVIVRVVEHVQCQLMYRNVKVVTNRMFCAASPEKDTCSGDSGGPALIKGQLCGIVSYGLGCARPNFPGIYIKINDMMPFLKAALLM